MARPARLAHLAAAAALVLVAPLAIADDDPLIPFQDYDPPSTLKVPEHPKARALYPFVDVHSHQPGMPEQDLAEVVKAMDEMNMAVMVNLSGRGFNRTENPDGTVTWGVHDPTYLARAVANAREQAPGRFLVFTNVDPVGLGEKGWTERAVAELEADVAAGATGLKIYKSLGMSVTDSSGARVAVDDPRLDPIWQRCGELGIPVLVHTADPAPFWLPKDGQNERLFELMERPGRQRDPATEPSWEQLIGEQLSVFRKHPETTFIAAHLAWLGNDLARLGRVFEEMPNVYSEIGAVLAELGRQPRNARRFLIQWQDRILFGKDSWQPSEYPTYFRTLETDDDYFPYYRRRHAFWRIYGLDLPDEVLRKIYYRNALRILPGIDRGLFPE